MISCRVLEDDKIESLLYYINVSMSIKNIIQINKSSKSIEKVDLKEPHSKVGDDEKARKYWNIIN